MNIDTIKLKENPPLLLETFRLLANQEIELRCAVAIADQNVVRSFAKVISLRFLLHFVELPKKVGE